MVVCVVGTLISKVHGNQLGADMSKPFDLEKMQNDLNDFLKKKYGNDVSVSIGANIVPLDKLNEKQKDLESGNDGKEELKQ